MRGFLALRGKERNEFLQSKFDYYRKFNTWIVIGSCLASLAYFISDCQLFQRFAWETLIPRTFILIPMLCFIIVNRKISDYRIMAVFSFLVAHMIMWCTVWAIIYLPDRTHASEGFIIMHLMFISIAYCAPFEYSAFFHPIIIVNILVSNLFNHYANLDIMLSLGIPLVIAILAADYMNSVAYYDHFITKNKLEDALITDNLTQVYNRNKLLSVIQDNKILPLYGEQISLLIIDIDYFKTVNDTYGHEKGDEVLVSVAEAVHSCIRAQDIVVRIGGEEFLVIMPRCPLEKAGEAAERMRKAAESVDNLGCPVTISIGISQYDNEDYLASISRTDEALYAAKRMGRNRVVLYENMKEQEKA